MAESVRLDKWLWAMRVFKTRPLATEACRLGKVSCAGQPAKPARVVKIGEEYDIESEWLTRTVRVRALRGDRVGAALVPDSLEELTDPAAVVSAKARRSEHRAGTPSFPAGFGRPTKAQRRALEKFNAAAAGDGEEE